MVSWKIIFYGVLISRIFYGTFAVHVIYAVGISGHVLNHFLGHQDNANPFLFECTRAHTCGRAHSRALSHKSTYTLNSFSVFSLADNVPKVHLQGSKVNVLK